MATNTERLDQHQKDIAGVTTELVRLREITRAAEAGLGSRLAGIEDVLKQVRTELGDMRTAVARHDERLKVLEKHSDHPAAISAHDQRLKALEKGTDRLWQFAPIVLSAFALLTAAYVAFVKK